MASLLPTYTVQSAVGDIILWPIVTNITSVPSGSSTTVSFTIDMIPIRQTNTRTTLGNYLVLRASGVNQVGYVSGPDLLSPSSVGLTWQQASDQWLQQYGMRTIMVRNLSTNYVGGCAAIALAASNTNSVVNTWNGITDSPIGPTSCTSIPISAYRCDITPASLSIDYGRVNAAEANGKVASTNFNMNCDGPVSFTFSSSSGATLALGSNLGAQLTIDGQPLNTKLTTAAGNTTHTLSAKLSATNIVAGVYSQSTALIINYL